MLGTMDSYQRELLVRLERIEQLAARAVVVSRFAFSAAAGLTGGVLIFSVSTNYFAGATAFVLLFIGAFWYTAARGGS